MLVCDGGRLVGVLTRTTLVREVVAPGVIRAPRGSATSPSRRGSRSTPTCRSTTRSTLLEEHDLERVPVVEDGRLVGVLSRAVVQRRLAEDEPPPDDE